MGGGTRLQKACGIDDTLDNMKAYIRAVTEYTGGDSDLCDLYCEESLPLYDWLEEQGVVFDEKADTDSHLVVAPQGIGLEYSGNERAWEYERIAKPAPRGHSPHFEEGSKGAESLFAYLRASVEQSGTDILYETEALDLVRDGSGRIVGVLAESDKKRIAVRANKGVVLATGAFVLNDEMVADQCPVAAVTGSRSGHPNDQGSGIRMAQRMGAGLKNMEHANITCFLYMYGIASGVLVNRYGQRFIDESSYGGWVGKAIYRQTPEKAYVIADQTLMASVSETHLKNLSIAGQEDTIEKLAETVGLEPNALASTVERYNDFAAAGSDNDFHKTVEFLTPVSTPPFYAIDFSIGHCSCRTLGGLKTDANAQVVDCDGKPMAGLYSAGSNACAIYGDYPGSGTSIGQALVFGRIAGKTAAAQ